MQKNTKKIKEIKSEILSLDSVSKKEENKKLNNWPIVKLRIKYPNCSSGKRKYSIINLKKE